MKNLFKFGFLAFAISLSIAACNTNKTKDNAADTIDSTAGVTSDSLENMADTVDSSADVKIDSVKQ